ncbi:hypothetical protein CCR85_04555 [Rhodothalassium salexigens]|uniref:metal ABC transporter permease n=1 Tax=Rhodothalassium salexigens TaxID=1086 RepID=UPI0019131EB9|nr:metal ABC transporter permease [Rhodothalassium salexigens]MBK5910763.1 hypothetical protein [Rhodothalassium salexigens]MBK5919787.1 hypothetical protein [Rhodothalassium salexigens]
MAEIVRLLSSYNTAVVLLAATLLGAAGAVAGTFALLHKRSLVSDAIGHAALPGIAGGFLVALAFGFDGRNLAILLSGAALSGALATVMISWIASQTRLSEDTAIATALAVFFGLGAVLLSVVQSLQVSGQAGLDSFLLGTTAAISAREAGIIAVMALLVALVGLGLFKEFRLLTFDAAFAGAMGYPVRALDLGLMALLLLVVALGLKTVGLILIVAIVILPPAAARFWTDRLGAMTALAALFGAAAGAVGAGASAVLDDLPTGGAIVMTAGALLLISLIAAPRRGLVAQGLVAARFRLARRRDGRAATGQGMGERELRP